MTIECKMLEVNGRKTSANNYDIDRLSCSCRTYQPKPRTSFESFILLFKVTTDLKLLLFGVRLGPRITLPTAVEIQTQFVLQPSNRLAYQFHQEVSFTLFHLPPRGFFLSLIFPLLSRAGFMLPNSRAKGAPVALITEIQG